VLGFAVAAPALGESAAQSYAASEVRIVNLIGTLEVTVGDEPSIVVDVSGPDGMADDVGIRVEGTTLVIARKGMIDHDGRPFDAATYPTVRVTLPAATALTITGMDGLANIGDILAPLIVRAASVDLTAGDLTSVVIDRSGSGRVELGDVSGSVVARLSGSGDFVVGTAGEADIEKRGSGDINVGAVAGAFSARVHGSGDVDISSAGTVSIEKYGSGDVTFGRVAGGFSYISFGIGNVDIAAVDGPVVIETSSSGEVHIRDGRADPLRVVMREYGNFTMDGESVDPDLTAEGASFVRLNSYRGVLVARGTGTFELNRRAANNL
jgi:hypothetical protein